MVILMIVAMTVVILSEVLSFPSTVSKVLYHACVLIIIACSCVLMYIVYKKGKGGEK